MIERIIQELGPWNWMVLGLLLLVLELLSPGIFLIWIGIAALLTGAVTLTLWSAAFWTWHVQVVVFLALAVAAVLIGRRITVSRVEQSDQPLLNRRADQLVGRLATLKEPITNGYGRVQIGDTLWRVAGPDLPVGSKVRVTRANDNELVVEPA
jgi:hypothetical protein